MMGGAHAADAVQYDFVPGSIVRVTLPSTGEGLMIRLADGWYSLPDFTRIWSNGDPLLSFSAVTLLAGSVMP